MGFSTNQCLHGKIPHEALLSRQEAELRVLDGMKRCINLRVKCDKDYASALSAVAIQGLKIVDRGDDLTGNLVSLAWKNIMEELENTSKLIKQNADYVETKIIDVFSALIVEKRKVKKTYQEEHSRIAQQFTHLSDEVSRKKQEYQKYLELYKLMRCKFEEIYIRGGRCGGRKLDEVRDKYQKACRKLHLTHNEYVLLLCEASEFEKDFRTVLLPGLLEHQQSLQESFIYNWKQILHDITTTLDLTSDKFLEIHRRIETSLDSIKPPYEEYKEFIDKYKSSAPNEPSKFIFDECLVEDSASAPAKLLPNQLTVDNLTVEWLRNKLSDLENSIKDFQEEKQRNSINGNSTDDANNHLVNGKTNDSNRLSLESSSSLRKKESNELRCHERNTLKQIELIKGALNELGCEEVPSGCDDISIENQSSLPTSPTIPTATTATAATTSPEATVADNSREEKQGDIDGSGDGGSGGGGGGGGGISNDEANKLVNKQTNNNLATFHYSERFVKMFLPNILSKKPFRWKNRVPSISASSSTCPSPVAPPRRGGKTSRSRESSMTPRSEGSDDGGGGGDTVISTNKSIMDEEWFHGVLPREEVVRLLTIDGDFLVRETTRNDECQTVLSVCWGGHKHFIVQTTAEGHYRFEGPAFPTIRDLILYQFTSGLPVTQRSKAILNKPIPRERWELNNDDVILLDKIGRGNFGDVYRAQLKNAKDIVAVKTCRVTLPEEHKKKFLQEGRILKQYDHPNIVKLIGICVQKQPIMIVMELVPGGSLLTFLRKKAATLTENQQLMKMCLDAAAGMKYLESKNCIHRDLAARNCLVGYNNIVKISDFGMSREEEEYIVSDGMKQIPIKWTAPEALNFGKYTSSCDVWSYGILCWEIFSKGDTPYNGMNNTKAREKIDNGYRMPAPQNTPAEMYRLMLSCWEYKPENRPNFERIYSIVETLYNAYRF